jgi:hypothetical protein
MKMKPVLELTIIPVGVAEACGEVIWGKKGRQLYNCKKEMRQEGAVIYFDLLFTAKV